MKKLLILSVFIFFLSQYCQAQYDSFICERPVPVRYEKIINKCGLQVKKLASHYFVSIVLSGGMGAVTGGLVKYIENQLNFDASPLHLFLLILSWMLEAELREDMILAIQKDLDAYGIGHKKNLMFKIAWISSWLAYLNV